MFGFAALLLFATWSVLAMGSDQGTLLCSQKAGQLEVSDSEKCNAFGICCQQYCKRGLSGMQMAEMKCIGPSFQKADRSCKCILAIGPRLNDEGLSPRDLCAANVAKLPLDDDRKCYAFYVCCDRLCRSKGSSPLSMVCDGSVYSGAKKTCTCRVDLDRDESSRADGAKKTDVSQLCDTDVRRLQATDSTKCQAFTECCRQYCHLNNTGPGEAKCNRIDYQENSKTCICRDLKLPTTKDESSICIRKYDADTGSRLNKCDSFKICCEAKCGVENGLYAIASSCDIYGPRPSATCVCGVRNRLDYRSVDNLIALE